MKIALLLLMAVASYAADGKYSLSFNDIRMDTKQLRIDIVKAFADAGITVKSVALNEYRGKEKAFVYNEYVVITDGQVGLSILKKFMMNSM